MLHVYPEKARKLDPAYIYNYIHGGRGIVRLCSPSGEAHSYLFHRPRNDETFPEDVLFVYAVHNNTKLFYVGMIENDKFRLTQYSRFGSHTAIVKGARYICRMALDPHMDTPMELYHQGVCAVCGRKLSSDKSLLSGVGPKCRKLIDAK